MTAFEAAQRFVRIEQAARRQVVGSQGEGSISLLSSTRLHLPPIWQAIGQFQASLDIGRGSLCRGRIGLASQSFSGAPAMEAHENPEQRNEFCRSIITRKIEATILTLEKSTPRSDKGWATLHDRATLPR
jgi:hypothetical protein